MITQYLKMNLSLKQASKKHLKKFIINNKTYKNNIKKLKRSVLIHKRKQF